VDRIEQLFTEYKYSIITLLIKAVVQPNTVQESISIWSHVELLRHFLYGDNTHTALIHTCMWGGKCW